MSNFESSSSSSFTAPVALYSPSSPRQHSPRKGSLNHRSLSIDTSPISNFIPIQAYHFAHPRAFGRASKPRTDTLNEKVSLYPLDGSHEDEDEDEGTQVNITIQCGIVDTIRNAFKQMRSRQFASALLIFVLFAVLVLFGGSMSLRHPAYSDNGARAPIPAGRLAAPSGRASMRIWSPPAPHVRGYDDVAVDVDMPLVYGRGARAAFTHSTHPSHHSSPRTPTDPQQPPEPLPASPSALDIRAPAPSPRVRVFDSPAIVIGARAGVDTDFDIDDHVMSAKFRLLYVEDVVSEPREHGHPDDVAALFNGGFPIEA
ncbi:hypothetical protein DL93DRAFT_2101111 [Clavulina sp. PMI_390]|nr:hypothetical protein DL93DRAFT_2101111 [Clavulina sp. PMI_390]